MNWKDLISKIALVVGFALLFGIIIGGQGFRDSVAMSVDFIFRPLADVLTANNLHILLLILSLITGLVTTVIQKYTIDWGGMKESQERMMNLQKEFKAAQLAGDTKRIAELNEESKRLMQDSASMQMQQLKPMGYISIITIPIIMWLYVYLRDIYGVYGFGTFTGVANGPLFIFPFVGERMLVDPLFLGLQWWFLWYLVCSIFFGQVFSKLLNTGMSTTSTSSSKN